MSKIKYISKSHTKVENSGAPKCPYCGWVTGEWMDGKTSSPERMECGCGRKYDYHTTTTPHGYHHVSYGLGRRKKPCMVCGEGERIKQSVMCISCKPVKPLKLGNAQKQLLKAMIDAEHYYWGCGWYWGSPALTERICQALLKKGLVRAEKIATTMGLKPVIKYTLTEAGRQVIKNG